MRRFTPATIATSITALAASTVLLAGCAVGPALPGGPATSPFTGTWDAPPPATGDTPSLILSADGSLGGTDGCNLMFGNWSASGATIEFRELGSTQMYCEGVDDWLIDAATGTLDRDTLTVFDANGDVLGELHRAV